SLDISNNTALITLKCDYNTLTSLDVSNNTSLNDLSCWNNSLTSLDVSNNIVLTSLHCPDNLLTSLDVRNGNNVNMLPFLGWFVSTGNPNLNCISVDDTTWANTNWSSKKDSGAIFSNDCMTVGIEDNTLNQPIITTHNNTITIKGQGTTNIFNLQGQRVHQSKFTGESTISLDKGIYLVRVTDSGRSVTKKVYLN
ncbi:MAG: T9SS type A sorting domain-containing protein, partial [Bacteroidetes bacterium]|nr:T9SS type A sorting domain-containing protein [Bacteroidota bacterium]